MRFVQDYFDVRNLESAPTLTGLALAATGLTAWIGFSVWAGQRGLEGFRIGEAWDTRGYFLVGLPLMAVAVAAAAFRMPRHALRWPLWLVAGHQLGVLIGGLGMQPGLSRLILVTALGMLLAVMFAVPALLGSIAARRLDERAY